MCDYENEIKYILNTFSDDEAIDKIKVETLKEDLIRTLEDDSFGVSLDELGLSLDDVNNVEFMYDLTEDDMEGLEDVKMASTKLIKLYRYVSTKRASGSSRRFCKELVKRTELSLMRMQDIEKLNSRNPGHGKGGTNSYSVFDWRGGVNCQHIWVKYFFNPDTKNLVKAPSNQQPTQAGKGRVRNA